MADEIDDLEESSEEPKKKGGSNKLLIIIIAATILLGAGGFVGFKLLADKGGENAQEEVAAPKSAILALDPFVLNLSDHGRYLKVTIQLEVIDELLLEEVKGKTPQLRDTIITLVSSKSLNSISSAEGKFQLKDELLFRTNQVVGTEKDMFKNLFFTEFVMQ